MNCLRGRWVFALCTFLFVCLPHGSSTTRAARSVSRLFNDIDGHTDHVNDVDDTNPEHPSKKDYLKTKPPKKEKSDTTQKSAEETVTTAATVTTPPTTTKSPETSTAALPTTQLQNTAPGSPGYGACESPTRSPKDSQKTIALSTPDNKVSVPKTISYELFYKKVTVEVVYESHCPNSRKFITSQLLPAYEQLRNYMHLTLLPFGRSQMSNAQAGNPSFKCTRGDIECRSNMVETCIVRNVRETLRAVHIVACMSRSITPYRVAQRCVEGRGLQWSLVEQCVTTKGKLYLLEMGKRTWKIERRVNRVPLIVVEGERDYAVEMEAQTDLTGLLCKRIPHSDERSATCASRRRK